MHPRSTSLLLPPAVCAVLNARIDATGILPPNMVSPIVARIWRATAPVALSVVAASLAQLAAQGDYWPGYSFHLLADPGGSVIGEGVGCGAREACGIALLVLTRSAVPP